MILFSLSSLCFAFTADEVIANLQSRQDQVKDLSADITMTMNNPGLVNTTGNANQSLVQKGKIQLQPPDKSRIELFAPLKQVTIANGTKIKVVQPDSGRTIVQDLSQLGNKNGLPASASGQFSIEKVKEFFDFTIKSAANGKVLLTGTPKKENKILGKIDFLIDSNRWVAEKITLYTAKGAEFSASSVDYREIGGLWIGYKTTTTITLPGGAMRSEMLLENIKVNQGIDAAVFKI